MFIQSSLEKSTTLLNFYCWEKKMFAVLQVINLNSVSHVLRGPRNVEIQRVTKGIDVPFDNLALRNT